MKSDDFVLEPTSQHKYYDLLITVRFKTLLKMQTQFYYYQNPKFASGTFYAHREVYHKIEILI